MSIEGGRALNGLFFVSERRPNASISLFKERTNAGEKGLLIARSHPDDIALKEELSEIECHWLLLREKKNSVRPSDLKAVEEIILSFFRRHGGGVTLLDGVEILCLFNDFEQVQKLLNSAQSAADACGGSIIVPVDDRALYPEDLKTISKNFRLLNTEG